MFFRDDRLVLSATDVTRHVGCAHATTLELDVARGVLEVPEVEDASLQLVSALGTSHEEGFRETLRQQGRQVVDIPPVGSYREREVATLEAMRAGAEVIYQATLFDGAWLGHADFLIRAERPSELGGWSYDIADTKLSRHLSVTALLQMAGYAERLAQLQGAPVETLTVVSGDGTMHPFRPVDVLSYARRVRSGLTGFLAAGERTAPVPTAACGRCRWLEVCTAQWEAQEDLSRVAGMRGDQRQALIDAGITTMAALAAADPEDLRGVLSSRVRDRLQGQAQIQVARRESGQPAYRFLRPETRRGLQRLPLPDEGDVYLDFEGDPFADGGQGREYLAGVWTREGVFHEWWAHSAEEEATLTRELLEWLVQRWERHPGMHVYHYAAYEVTALKRMTMQHSTGASELDQLLRGERFVDLYQVVRQGLLLSTPSYSIKKVEDFYWGQARTAAEGEVADGMASVVEYERWLAEGRVDQGVLDAIRRYNEEDVRSTLALHEWLEERRAELARDHELTRYEGPPKKETVDTPAMLEEQAMARRLVEGGHELLAGLVGWHRREDKAHYWELFRTPDMTTEELVEDGATIGDVGAPEAVGEHKRSTIWRYRFPPQEGKVRPGTEPAKDALTHETVGTVHAVDLEAGWIEVRRGNGREPLRPRGLVQKEVINVGVIRDALLQLGEDALAGRDTLGLRLLDRRTPAIPAPRPGESAGELMRRVGTGLSGEVLAVQGPPGAGKSYNAALLIRDLLDQGRRVGVTAQSHRVIGDLMDKVGRPGIRKVSDRPEGYPDDALVSLTTDNKVVAEAIRDGGTLIGGTPWLWARPEMAEAVDVLVIDEAGQFSLANAAAVAQGARSLVMLGDPQQLRSPTNATHPYGSGVSALEHLMEGRETIDPARGVFLDTTWRMHPDITGFVSELAYEGRLAAQDLTAQQVVQAPGLLTGSGLRWVPVEHAGNSSCSPEEAQVVRGLVDDLLGGNGTWTNEEGVHGPLRPQDILVVAPYNAHVQELRDTLPHDVQVGTVDKFQGHEGAVVIYSMASSSVADAPRGVDFLYDVHRLNVAISRARALAVIVGSPALLEAPVSSPAQLRAVNALCRFVDEAAQVTVSSAPGSLPRLGAASEVGGPR
ncbi:TM0106 family RecB-like putative nuclease [Ornithinimicrobium sp. Y1694]|uniref:TM0106 family RecB-like putative nuclease n=1 Tax=Ornithinimicrobium sp. Y1694 TaxID=3418590 RepID=UPI003CF96712